MAAPLSTRAAGWSTDVRKAGRYLGQTCRLMLGVPDYQTYLDHMAATHPGKPAMSYEAFFRERQEARFGGKGRVGRCC